MSGGGIAEVWRLPDGPWGVQLAVRQDNWHGFYHVLPDYGGTIKVIPDGSTPLIIGGAWV